MAPKDNALTRFSDRVADYARFRPGYPASVVACLTREFGMQSNHVVVDLGSGTGLSAVPFLDNGNVVVGVEPNREMREAAERQFAGRPSFRSMDGKAEATGLDSAIADWIVAAQAFHWFDVEATKAEALRILRPGGRALLMWNDWRADRPFLRDYESVIERYAIDYHEVNHRNAAMDGRIASFFEPGGFERRSFPNEQVFDFAGLKGRLLSSSYMPRQGHYSFDAMLAELRSVFDRHAVAGFVRFEYETKCWIGMPTGGC